MPFLGGLLEADGLSMPTMMPHLGFGPKFFPLTDGDTLIQSHLAPAVDPASVAGTATAFLQAHPRKLVGLAAAGVTELLGNMPRARRSGFAGRSTAAVCMLDRAGCSNHEEFLFGGKVPFDSITPTQSMFVGWFAAARETWKGDPNEERVEEDEPRGWSKVIPRSLIFFTTVDVISALVAFTYRKSICDAPLRTWLWGGILLGAPTDLFVKGLFWILKPRYKYYRLICENCRDAMGTEFDINTMEFFDEFGRQVPTEFQGKEGHYYEIVFRYPTMISSYRIITSTRKDAAYDPVTWDLKATNRKMTLSWAVIDQMDERVTENMPTERGAATDYYTELTSLSENNAIRQAFLAELFANAASFAWLVTGSAWIARSSETCVDSAPELWYYCFLYAVLTWSCLGTLTMGLIVSAVAMIVLGAKGSS